MHNTPCPIATPEDDRRQLCNRSKEDETNKSKHSRRSTPQPSCVLVGAPKLEMPTQPSCAVWSVWPPSALAPAPLITHQHLYLGHSNLHPAGGFWISDRCVLLMEGSSGDSKAGQAGLSKLLLKNSKMANVIQATGGSLYYRPASPWG